MAIVLVPFWLIVYRGYKESEPGAVACVPGQFLAPSVQYEYYTYRPASEGRGAGSRFDPIAQPPRAAHGRSSTSPWQVLQLTVGGGTCPVAGLSGASSEA